MPRKEGIHQLKFEIWTGIIVACAWVYLGECLWGTERKHSTQKAELVPDRMTGDKLEGWWGLRKQRGMWCEIRRQRPNMEPRENFILLVSNIKKSYWKCMSLVRQFITWPLYSTLCRNSWHFNDKLLKAKGYR